jgi:hypothetical protein
MTEEIGLRIAESLNLSISDDDLLSKVKNREDNFIERKPVKDTRGWLHTAVAFANSCPVGYPGVNQKCVGGPIRRPYCSTQQQGSRASIAHR